MTLHVKLLFTDTDENPVSDMTIRISDHSISTQVPFRLIADADAPLIHNGRTEVNAAGEVEFWTDYTKSIRVEAFNTSNELVYSREFGPIFQADGLSVALVED